MHKLIVVNIDCNGKRFTSVQAVFLDKDGTLANVANYLSQLGKTQAQLMENQLTGTYQLNLSALGFTSDGLLSASGMLAVGSRQEAIAASATAAEIAGYPWVKAMKLATATWTATDRQCSPKASYTPLLPGVPDFLQRLRRTRLKIIMVSADSQKNLEEFVDYYQLQPYFDKIQGVSDQYPSKTAPSFLQAACQAVGMGSDEGVVIGDAATDWQMAQTTRGFIGFLGGWQPQLSEDAIVTSSDRAVDYAFATAFDQITII